MKMVIEEMMMERLVAVAAEAPAMRWRTLTGKRNQRLVENRRRNTFCE